MQALRQHFDIFQIALRGIIATAACLVITACGGGGGEAANDLGTSRSGDSTSSDSTPSDSKPSDSVDRYIGTWASNCAGDASQNPAIYERLIFNFTKVSATSIASEGRHEYFGTDSTCSSNGSLISSSHSIAEFTGNKTLADGKVVDMFKVTETTADDSAGDVRLSIMFIQDRSLYSGIDNATAYPDAVDMRIALTRP
jgi:hypothetical protein